MKYKKYPQYKDSGIEWFGNIPEHWEAVGFKRHFESIVDYRGKTPEKVDNGIFLVTARNIKKGVINYKASSEYVMAKDYKEIMSRGIPKIGDVLFTTEAPLGEVANVDNTNIALAQRVIKFCAEPDIQDNYYLKYLMMSSNFQNSLMLYASGSTALGIKAERLVYLRKLLPSLQEQQTIANYLDKATAKIDTLIEKQTKLIKLLKEKRQAVISTAVTRGLDNSVPMKDSGVEWLGEIPEHWDTSRLKFLCNITTGGKDTENKIDDGKYPFYVRSQTIEKINSYSYNGEAILTAGDGVGVGKVFHYATGKFDFHQRVYMFYSFKKVAGKFLFEYIKNNFYKVALAGIAKSTVDSLRLPLIQNFMITVPPLVEQKSIVSYIDDKTTKIDNLLSNANKSIVLLKERRTALISAVVTGKIDVREEIV